ncbi:hypothetical protein KKC91_05595 [bacterium]|nr:hypothetical protein [bacterium]
MKSSKVSIQIIIAIMLLVGLMPLGNILNDIKEDAGLADRFIQRPALGFDNIASDVLWIKTIQYMAGVKKADVESSDIIYQMFERVTDLDPLFTTAYTFGGLAISHTTPAKSLILFDKAIAHNPNIGWRIPMFAGVISMHNMKNYDKSAKYFALASEVKDSPMFLKRMQALAKARAGDLGTALILWESLYNSSDSASVQIAGRELVRVAAEILKTSTDNKLRNKADRVIKGIL